MMGKLNAIPGVFTFLRPFPVLEISTGVTSQQQGQYALRSLMARILSRFTRSVEKLMAKLMSYPGFLTVSSDFYHNTPNVNIDLRRDQAKTYGVSEAKILTMLRNAYSQNYLYLIKKPEDQYQVILEVADEARANPDDLKKLYIRSDDGQRLVPLRRVGNLENNARATDSEPLESVYECDALLQPQTGCGARRCDELHQQDGGGSCAIWRARGTGMARRKLSRTR